MSTTRVGRLLLAAAVGTAAGCVDRRFVVQSNVPGAQAYVDGAPLGATPADGQFEYYGYRKITVVAPGYEPLTERVQFSPKWYEFPPIDLFAEAVWPFRIEDRRVVTLALEPARPVNEQALVGAGDALRARGQSLPPTKVPKDDRRPVTPPTQALPIGNGGFNPLPNTFLPGGAATPPPTTGTVDRDDQAPGLPGGFPTAPTAPPNVPPAGHPGGAPYLVPGRRPARELSRRRPAAGTLVG